MVFQDYALFPHLKVEQNLFYGLNLTRPSKEQKAQNEQIVKTTARNLDIESLMNRFPSELSGGQQQRVALGRALVLQPKILLMDEPLSSLDTNLRLKVREELKEIQQRLKITTVYVTHDREEAFSLSDKIAVMNNGKIVQYDTPENLYFEPKNRFAAEFSGAANFILQDGKTFLVRPDWLTVNEGILNSAESKNKKLISGKIISSSFLGSRVEYKIQTEQTENQILTADLASINPKIETGANVTLEILRQIEIG